MAPSPPLDRRRQLPAAASPLVGASTAQAALARIIAIITAGPPPSPPLPPRPDAAARGSTNSVDPEEVLGTVPPSQQPPEPCIDLSLRLGPSTEIGGGSAEGDLPAPRSVVEDVSTAVGCDGGPCAARTTSETVPGAAVTAPSLSPAVSSAGGGAASAVAKSSESECDSKGENRSSSGVREKAFAEREESKGSGGGEAGTTTTTTILSSSNSSTGGKGRALRSEGCLDLLLEAVRQISGSAFDGDDGEPGAEKRELAAAEEEAPAAPASGRTRRSAGGGAREKRRREPAECWIPFDLYEDDTAPIVRSKRGRNQAMPSKFRDCVLDAWRKPPALTRPGRGARP